MPLIATDLLRLSNTVKHEYEPALGFCREVVTVNEATAKTYVVGTVLGVVTATGKYKISVQNAADGSQTPAAVVIQDLSIAATTDTKVLVIARGPAILGKTALGLDASFGTQAQKDAAYAALAAKNILVNDQV